MGIFDRFRKKTPQPAQGPKTEEYSPGGSPIYRYETPEDQGFRPPEETGRWLEEIDRYFAERFPDRGHFVFHELVSDLMHIDLHILRPAPEANYYVVYTTGMSDMPMNLPEDLADREDLKYAELYLLLPGDWDIGEDLPTAEQMPYESFWPLQALKFLARFPHEYKTWLSWGHTIPNGPEYAPLCDGLGFGGLVLDALNLVPPMETQDGHTIHFFLTVPAYKEEIEYKLKYGMEGLTKRFAEGDFPVVLDVRRPNLCADFHEVLD